MKVKLLLELEEGVDPVSAARAFSEAPRVVRCMSIVDEMAMEMWVGGQHLASETSHPRVQDAWKRAKEEEQRMAESRV